MTISVSNIIKKYVIILILIALIVIFALVSPAFRSLKNAMNIVRQISMMSIVTVGFTFVIIGGGLDLSIGSQIAIMNVSVALMIDSLDFNPILAVIIGIIMTTSIGWFNGFIVSKTGVPPLIATLAMMTALRGTTYIISKGFPIYGIPDYLKTIGQGYVFQAIPIPALIMASIISFGIIFLNKTYMGRYIYCIGSNTEAARLAGINVNFVRTMSYTLLGFLTGIAALVMLTRVGSGQPNIAEGFEMNVLTAAVLGGVSINGGKGNIPGAMIGAAIIGVLNNGMSLLGANDYWQKVITGVVLLIVTISDNMSYKRKIEWL